MKRTLETRKITQLRNHPLNQEVFGELIKSNDLDSEFMHDVKNHGVYEPLIITDKNLIVSGHRRKQAAALAGEKEVPVIVARHLKTDAEVNQAWFSANMQREKTTEQKARWYEKRKEIEASAAAKRMKSGKAADPPETVPEGSGEARDIAAAEVGMSGKTADKAVEVVHEIDAAEESGDTERAEDLRSTLNNGSVASAHRKATREAVGGNGSPPAAALDNAKRRKIPKRLLPVFEFGGEASTASRSIVKSANAVLKLEIPTLPASAIKVALKDLKAALNAGLPHAVCPHCNGRGCKQCSKHGYVTKDQWNGIPEDKR